MNVVFVHLGKSPAKHLWANLKYFDREFPEIAKFIILTETSHKRNLKNISIETLIVDEKDIDSNALQTLEHNSAFRSGFWKYSLQRFYALRLFQQIYPNESLIHFESDILVLPNFPWENFNFIKTVSWPKFNETSDAASVFYSPSQEALNQLILELEAQLQSNPKLTDMTALSILSNSQSIPYYELPTTIARNSEKSLEEFGGIFDAAALGMWLCGRDPRNHLGWVKRFEPLPEASFDASKYKYIFSEDKLELQTQDGKMTTIYNLHLHSKREKLFGKFWRIFLHLDVLTAQNKKLKTWFVPSAFYLLSRDYFFRNGYDLRPILKVARRFKDKNAS